MSLIKKYLLLLSFLTVFSIVLSASSLRTIKEQTFQVDKGQLLELESDLGDVDIKTWDKDEVYIKILGDRDAEDDVRFTLKKTSDGVLVDGEAKHGGWFSNLFRSMRVKYEIKVPKIFDLSLETGGGDVQVLNIEGNQKIKTSGGDIYVEALTGNLYAETSGGDIKIRNTEGDLDLGTSGGDIDINSSEGRIDAGTSGGDITLRYQGENKGVDLSTSGGDIMVFVSKDFEADVYLTTSGGDVECRLPNSRADEISSDEYKGRVNGGGERLRCDTSGGDIIVRELR